MSKLDPAIPPPPSLVHMIRNPEATHAFQHYVSEGGERTLARTAHALGISEYKMRAWSSRYRWGELVVQADTREAMLAQQADEKQRASEIRERRHARLRAASMLRTWAMDILEVNHGLRNIPSSVAVQMLTLAGAEERRDLGEDADADAAKAAATDPLARFRSLAPARIAILVDLLKETDGSFVPDPTALEPR